jgi:hypothetical protein
VTGTPARIVAFLIEGLKDREGRVRVEELLSAAASIVGERCIEAAGDFDARNHALIPGSRVFSDSVNELLCGEVAGVDAVPAGSVIGIVRDGVVGRGYELAEFPSLEEIFRSFAAGIGDPAQWGFVPLTVPEENRPFLMPLRAAYETRTHIDRILGPDGDARSRLREVALALAEALVEVAEAIDHRLALRLVLETLNGMSKTAPMTDEAFRLAAEQP